MEQVGTEAVVGPRNEAARRLAAELSRGRATYHPLRVKDREQDDVVLTREPACRLAVEFVDEVAYATPYPSGSALLPVDESVAVVCTRPVRVVLWHREDGRGTIADERPA